MKDKLTLQDIVDLLAKKTSLNKKEADAFFREFFAVIVDNVFDNEPVKIKDFGSFKLTKVSSRESVNVNTGEKIEIPAHYKLSFLPDKTLKLLLNKPFAHFETTLLEEGVSFDSIEESEEPVILLEEEDTSVEDNQIDEQETIKEKPPLAEKSISSDKKEAENKKEETTAKKDIVEDASASAEDRKPETNERAASSSGSTVYTYVLNYDISESSSISVSMPAGVLSSRPAQKEEETIQEDLSGDNVDHQPVAVEKIVAPEQEDPETKEDGDKTPPIEVNKVQEKIDQLKEAIEALTNKEPMTEEPTVEEEQEEILLDIEIPVSTVIEDAQSSQPEEPKKEDNILPEKEEENEEVAEADDEFVEADFTKIGFNIGDDVEEIKTEGKQMESVVLKKATTVSYNAFKDVADENMSSGVTDKDGVDELLDEIVSDQDYLEEYQYTDYYKDTAFSRFKGRLPIIIILLVIIGIGVYMFYNLFNVRQDFPSYGGYQDFLPSDTLVDDSEPLITPDSVGDVYGMPEPSGLTTQDGNEETGQETDVITPAALDRYEKVISDRLKIGVVNKAAYMQERELEEQTGISRSASGRGSAGLATITVERGFTFPAIATKYYGNRVFWVYIYEENRDIIPDYNNLAIGMELVIPALEKYNTSLNDPQAIEKAKTLERLIFSSGR